MRRLVASIAAGFLAFTLGGAGSLGTATPVAAATLAETTTCANGVDDTGGLGVICEVTIVNTITASGGSATVTVRECHGAAGDPEAACTIDTQVLTSPVTAVNQCNAATNGGGGTLRCSVHVTNNFVVDPNPTSATVNQCVGSGDGDTTGCDPFPASTTGATITQCNGSANGGTLVGLTCIASGTESGALDLTINQCNGSANGGGALVICSAQIDNEFEAPVPSATPAPSGIPALSPSPTSSPAGGGSSGPSAGQSSLPPTDVGPIGSSSAPGGSSLVPILVIGLASILVLMATWRRAERR